MARAVTLFTGQWADLPIETMCQKAQEFGYDDLGLYCRGNDKPERAKSLRIECVELTKEDDTRFR